MPNKSWKQVERRVAAFFGGVRNALSGANSGVCRGDVRHDRLTIEVKMRAKHSAVTLWDDTAKHAKKEGKVPVVVLAEKHRPGFWVLCHSSDLTEVGAIAELAPGRRNAFCGGSDA